MPEKNTRQNPEGATNGSASSASVDASSPPEEITFEKLISDYQQSVPAQCAKLGALMCQANQQEHEGEPLASLTQALGIAHGFAGTAGSLGFEELSEMGSALEGYLSSRIRAKKAEQHPSPSRSAAPATSTSSTSDDESA